MEQSQIGRKKFIQTAALGAALSTGIPELVNQAFGADKPGKIKLDRGEVILFQGDSVTDSGRQRDNLQANSAQAMGGGYALMAGGQLLQRAASKNLQIYNRGISGNKVFELAARWETDCIQLKPGILSILVGVNDFWHTLSSGYKGTIETYKGDYRKLIDRTLQQLPNLKLIIGEPYGVSGIKAVDNRWYPEFNAYREAAASLASEYKAVFIPYQKIYDMALQLAPGVYWTADGVHPSMAGCGLMAQAWLETIQFQ